MMTLSISSGVDVEEAVHHSSISPFFAAFFEAQSCLFLREPGMA